MALAASRSPRRNRSCASFKETLTSGETTGAGSPIGARCRGARGLEGQSRLRRMHRCGRRGLGARGNAGRGDARRHIGLVSDRQCPGARDVDRGIASPIAGTNGVALSRARSQPVRPRERRRSRACDAPAPIRPRARSRVPPKSLGRSRNHRRGSTRAPPRPEGTHRVVGRELFGDRRARADHDVVGAQKAIVGINGLLDARIHPGVATPAPPGSSFSAPGPGTSSRRRAVPSVRAVPRPRASSPRPCRPRRLAPAAPRPVARGADVVTTDLECPSKRALRIVLLALSSRTSSAC